MLVNALFTDLLTYITRSQRRGDSQGGSSGQRTRRWPINWASRDGDTTDVYKRNQDSRPVIG